MMMKKKKEGGNISWHLSPTLSQFPPMIPLASSEGAEMQNNQ